jgi:hypothetical protein
MSGRKIPSLAAILLPVLFAAAPARAGDISVFMSRGNPSEAWRTGYGAALTSTWFRVLSFEGEAARLPGELPDETMTSFTGSAFIAPPLGKLIPYGGVGLGLFRQSRGERSDTGVLRTFALGVKLQLGLLLVRGEYRRMNLSGEPLIEIDSRVSAGVGIAF